MIKWTQLSRLFLPQVVDVAKAIISAVRDPDANGKTYALVGYVSIAHKRVQSIGANTESG